MISHHTNNCAQDCSWLPVDTLASVILELAFLQTTPEIVYNLQSPHTFSWTATLLPLLKSAGLVFTPSPISIWLAKLRESANTTTVEQNPAVKLVEYYERAYGKGNPGGKVDFEIGKAERDSETLRNAPDLVKDGYIERFLETWLKSWGHT